jgi:hypothetical protein
MRGVCAVCAVVVANDRSFPHAICGTLNYSQEETERAIEWGLKFLPRPMRTILIDVLEEVAFARKDDVPHLDYLRERRKWYLTRQKRAEVKRFNGEEAPQKLVEALLADVAAHNPVMIGEMSQ